MAMSSQPVQTSSSRLPALRLVSAVRGEPASSLSREILAGVTLAALMIPLNIGYAQVAGLPPIVGLYAAILPMIAFALTSYTRHVVASPDAAAAAMIAVFLAPLAVPGDPRYMQLAFAQALLCGLVFFVAWAFRLGFLANFLSHAVLVGFISGLGVEVLVSQIEKILGVSVEAEGFFRELWAIILAIPQASGWSIFIGVGTIVVIRALQRFAPQLPGALIALVVATIVVAALGLAEHGVSVLGSVPAGLPKLALPDVSLSDYLALLPGALALFAVTLAEAPLIARSYAERYGERTDVDQDLFAFGAANVAAGVSGGLSLGSSTSRTAAMDSAGARSQIPSLVAGVVVAVLLLFFTDLLAYLPNAALAGIVANAVVSLIEVGEFRKLWQERFSEFLVAGITVLSVLILGALVGVIMAFLLSLIDLIARASRPHAAVLVELPGGQAFDTPAEEPVTMTRPGLVIYRFDASLYFANATLFQESIQDLVRDTVPPVRWFVLDAAAINDIDTSGARALTQAVETLQAQGVTFAISRVHASVREVLRRYGMLELIGTGQLFATNREAVAAFGHDLGKSPVREPVVGAPAASS
jgi:sulfate permease, SulP family